MSRKIFAILAAALLLTAAGVRFAAANTNDVTSLDQVAGTHLGAIEAGTQVGVVKSYFATAYYLEGPWGVKPPASMDATVGVTVETPDAGATLAVSADKVMGDQAISFDVKIAAPLDTNQATISYDLEIVLGGFGNTMPTAASIDRIAVWKNMDSTPEQLSAWKALLNLDFQPVKASLGTGASGTTLLTVGDESTQEYQVFKVNYNNSQNNLVFTNPAIRVVPGFTNTAADRAGGDAILPTQKLNESEYGYYTLSLDVEAGTLTLVTGSSGPGAAGNTTYALVADELGISTANSGDAMVAGLAGSDDILSFITITVRSADAGEGDLSFDRTIAGIVGTPIDEVVTVTPLRAGATIRSLDVSLRSAASLDIAAAYPADGAAVDAFSVKGTPSAAGSVVFHVRALVREATILSGDFTVTVTDEYKTDGTVTDPDSPNYYDINESNTRGEYTAKYKTGANQNVYMSFEEGDPLPLTDIVNLPSAARANSGEWTAPSDLLTAAASGEVVQWTFTNIPRGKYYYVVYDDTRTPIAVSGAITAFTTLSDGSGNGSSGVGCDAGFAFFGLFPLLPLIVRRRR